MPGSNWVPYQAPLELVGATRDMSKVRRPGWGSLSWFSVVPAFIAAIVLQETVFSDSEPGIGRLPTGGLIFAGVVLLFVCVDWARYRSKVRVHGEWAVAELATRRLHLEGVRGRITVDDKASEFTLTGATLALAPKGGRQPAPPLFPEGQVVTQQTRPLGPVEPTLKVSPEGQERARAWDAWSSVKHIVNLEIKGDKATEQALTFPLDKDDLPKLMSWLVGANKSLGEDEKARIEVSSQFRSDPSLMKEVEAWDQEPDIDWVKSSGSM